jgi:hypothetical protein
MKGIRTRYYGATNTKGSKIIATDGDRNLISIGYPHGLNSDEAHELAAYLLMRKMGWPNQLIGGGFQNDMYWTMVPVAGRDAKPAYADFLASERIKAEYAA